MWGRHYRAGTETKKGVEQRSLDVHVVGVKGQGGDPFRHYRDGSRTPLPSREVRLGLGTRDPLRTWGVRETRAPRDPEGVGPVLRPEVVGGTDEVGQPE